MILRETVDRLGKYVGMSHVVFDAGHERTVIEAHRFEMAIFEPVGRHVRSDPSAPAIADEENTISLEPCHSASADNMTDGF